MSRAAVSTGGQESFITEVATSSHESSKIDVGALLQPVRVEHKKLMGVAESFGQKVDLLVEKQRSEYIQAYEHHMHDVQKELHILREKASEIANDKTKEEKLSKLENDQKFFRNEAIRLDFETTESRKKLRNILSKAHSVEKERDWLLKKLRKAKSTFRHIKKGNIIL
jgi:uncharacterized protein (DUF342 family)